MRVLFCALDYPPSAAGGAEQQARLQAESLVRRGIAVDVVCARTPGHTSQRIAGVRVHRLHRVEVPYLRTITYLAMLCAFLVLRAHRYDVLHVHLANLQADVVALIGRLRRRPVYVKVAAGGPLGEIGRMRVVSGITRYVGLRHATVVQAISDEIAEDLRGIGIPPDRIRRIPNGVIAPAAVASAAEKVAARAELGLAQDSTTLLFAGRFERAKGLQDLLDAWRELDLPDAQLVLVGRPGLKEPVPMDRLPPGVVRREWTADIATYLRATDVFVLPSYAEGMSNALLEAMAAGLACISTRVGAASEMIENGVSGVLVDAGDRHALGREVALLARDRSLREELGGRARETVMTRYDIERVVDRIEGEYRALMRS